MNNINKKNCKNKLPQSNKYICDAFSRISQIMPKKYYYSIPEEVGKGYFRQISIKNDIIITEFRMKYNQDMKLMGSTPPKMVDIAFCLGEGVEWKNPDEINSLYLNKGETYISNNRNGLEKIYYKNNKDYNFIGIKLPQEQFYNILSKFISIQDANSIQEMISSFEKFQITPSMNIILKQLINCPYINTMQEMYIRGKLLELLSVYLSEIILQKSTFKANSIILSRPDKESILKAKEIIDKNIKTPPACIALSKMVYLSESKLTKGFKAIFETTIHNYITNKRIETAMFLFEQGESQVSTVANMVGYCNMSHFSTAFRKKYGINPSKYLKDKKIKNHFPNYK